MSIDLRPMLPTDITECMEIGRETGLNFWSRDGFETELARPDAIAIAALTGELVVGFIIGRIIAAEHSSEIYNIGVRPSAMRAGIGSKLLHAFEGESRKHNVNNIWLEVRESNEGATAFYRSAGFIEVSVRKGFYENPPEDASLMAKKI